MDNDNLTTKPLPSLIPRLPINSSLLYSVGYDPDTETLIVQFRNRKGEPANIYTYRGVPQQIYDDLTDPAFIGSRGRYFTELVKKAGYSYEKVEE